MGHHTKDKGDLGVAKAHADLVEQGFLVLFPTTEHAPFDLVAYRDETFFRVQVKYRAAKNGALRINFRSTWADRHGIHTKPTDKGLYDVLCVYCPETNECYYISPNDYRNSVSIRLVPTRNNQALGVTLAANCRVLSVGERITQELLI